MLIQFSTKFTYSKIVSELLLTNFHDDVSVFVHSHYYLPLRVADDKINSGHKF